MNKFKSADAQKNYQDKTVVFPFHALEEFNKFYRPYAEALQIAPKKEMPKILQTCCDKCNKQYLPGGCQEYKCYLYHNYSYWMNWASDGARVIYKNQPPKTVYSHKYEITPHMSCSRTVAAQISKAIKKDKNNIILTDMKAEVENKNQNGSIKTASLRKIMELATKNGFIKIADTVGRFLNGKLGTIKTENK